MRSSKNQRRTDSLAPAVAYYLLKSENAGKAMKRLKGRSARLRRRRKMWSGTEDKQSYRSTCIYWLLLERAVTVHQPTTTKNDDSRFLF